MRNNLTKNIYRVAALLFAVLLLLPMTAQAQYEFKEMNVGTLHNFFVDIGCEVEVVRNRGQQDGWQWPAQFTYQDCQAARAFWIGVTNFTDETGTFPYRVVHVGPRVTGIGEFFPQEMKLVSKFEPPQVVVDGIVSYDKVVENDEVDPTIPSDRMIVNKVNSLVGITMDRKIYGWSHPDHGNYIIQDYTFTNTGNTDDDAEIELPNNTLTGVYFFWQYRWASCKQTRYVIANGTGWGMNQMHDARGDGFTDVNPDWNPPEEEQYRCQFSWHGYFPDKIVSYDNMGGPIWTSSSSAGYVANSDTVGRLGAPQFVGALTLHADKSAADSTDDTNQPSTTVYFSSDDIKTSNNTAFDPGKMQTEYTEWLAFGHMYPRHAYAVEPSGDFAVQTNSPDLGTPGGFSAMDGYGPYTMAPGETIRIVIAEGAAGLDRDACIEIGKQYKQGIIDAEEKNRQFLTGKDSLMKTWKFATDNFNSDYTLASDVPWPPSLFEINSGGDRISLTWTPSTVATGQETYRIYRSTNLDSQFTLIHETGPGVTTYDDTQLLRGISYFYYVSTVGTNGIESSRFYTQSYNPATLKRPAGEKMTDIRVVPNPFVLSADINTLRFGEDRANQIAFFEVPGRCTIKIYTEIGELIETIEHTDGSGDVYWNSTTSSGQIIVSGIYIAVVENLDTGERETVKFAVIR